MHQTETFLQENEIVFSTSLESAICILWKKTQKFQTLDTFIIQVATWSLQVKAGVHGKIGVHLC